MNVWFTHCRQALTYAAEHKSFGVFHSTENNPDGEIHTHNCCELLLCVKGGKNFLINDRVYEAQDGDLFIANQFEAHKVTFWDNAAVERYVIQIHPDFLFSSSTDQTDLSACFYHRPAEFSHRLPLSPEEQEQLVDWLKQLEQSYEFGDDVIKRSIAALLLTFVNQLFSKQQNPPRYLPSGREDPLQAAILYINRHFGEELTLDKIAKSCFLSANQLCRIFKDTLGTTVMKYVIGKRISEAKKYLKAGYNVSDTAFMCGFRDYSNFIRTFTASAGISPGKYAKAERIRPREPDVPRSNNEK